MFKYSYYSYSCLTNLEYLLVSSFMVVIMKSVMNPWFLILFLVTLINIIKWENILNSLYNCNPHNKFRGIRCHNPETLFWCYSYIDTLWNCNPLDILRKCTGRQTVLKQDSNGYLEVFIIITFYSYKSSFVIYILYSCSNYH